MGFPGGTVAHLLDARDANLIPELEKIPSGKAGNPFQYSYILENSWTEEEPGGL